MVRQGFRGEPINYSLFGGLQKLTGFELVLPPLANLGLGGIP